MVGQDGATNVSDRPRRRQKQEANSLSRKVRCPQCESGDLVIRQCRAVCDNCGYVESCEDNFVPNQANPKERLAASD
jgi:hypothetical protein